jgi:hypothetical protein
VVNRLPLSRAAGIAVLVVLLATLVSAPIFADLDDFRRDVEEEEDRDRGPEEEPPPAAEDDGERSNPLAALLYEITIFAWRLHNMSVFYAPYPYAGDPPPPGIRPRGFVHVDPQSVRIEEDFSLRRAGRPRKRYWFEVTTGGLATDDGAWGGMASLQGRFTPFFGPDVDTRFLFDGEDELNITTAGVDMSIIQHDYFTWTLYGKWAVFRGVLERDGGAVGSQIHSYIANPVSLHLRSGALIFPNIAFAQIEGRLAVHLNRFAVFGGANLLQSESSRLLSVESGLSVAW